MEGLNRDADEQISNPESQRSASMLTEWTDEKHSLYLKSMEASFVDQLYSSMDLHGSRLQDDCSSDLKSSRQMHVSTRIPSGQFKVHRDGSWGRINFRRPESASNTVAASRDISANPWIRHFRSGGRHQNVATQSLQGKTSSATSNWFHVSKPDLCCQDSAGIDTEVMDQNFVDEDLEKVVASQECNINKTKTSVVASSSNDQVVPSRELSTTHDEGKLCPPLDK